MKPLLLIALFFCLCAPGYGQYFSRTSVCGSDTVRVSRRSPKYPDDTSTFRGVKCLAPGKMGIRIDIGRSNYRYNPQTASWLGRHAAASFGLHIAYAHLNVGVRAKVATVIPERPLLLGTDTLQSPARVNPVKVDYCLGYSFDFRYNVSLEPFAGYTRSPFYAAYDSAAGGKKEYTLPLAHGLLLGLSVNKYFKIRGFEHFALFFNASYSTTNFRRVDGSLGQGYIEWTYGLAYKGFPNVRFYRKVE